MKTLHPDSFRHFPAAAEVLPIKILCGLRTFEILSAMFCHCSPVVDFYILLDTLWYLQLKETHIRHHDHIVIGDFVAIELGLLHFARIICWMGN